MPEGSARVEKPCRRESDLLGAVADADVGIPKRIIYLFIRRTLWGQVSIFCSNLISTFISSKVAGDWTARNDVLFKKAKDFLRGGDTGFSHLKNP